MKFIFPQNYNFRMKLFGFIDYTVAIFNIVLWIILYFLVNLFFHDLYLKIILFLSISFPILILSISGLNHENFFYVFRYIYKFLKTNRVYLYIKE